MGSMINNQMDNDNKSRMEDSGLEILAHTQSAFERFNLGKILRMQFLARGEINNLFLVETNEFGVEVLKIAPRWDGRNEKLKASRNSADLARSVNVMTPATRFIGEWDQDLGNFAIEQYVSGERIVSFENTLSRFSVNIYSALQRIHSIRVQGNGELDAQGIGDSLDWQSKLIKYQNESLTSIYASDAHIKIGNPLLDSIGRELSDTSTIIPNMNRLLHGDFKFENLIVIPEGLAVIDWENAMGGDPLYDYAFLELFEDLPEFAIPIMNIENEQEIGEYAAERFKHYQGTIGLRLLAWYASQGDNTRLELFKKRLSERF